MFLHRSFVPGLAIYSYMVGDEASGRCAVIDPTRDVEPYIRTAREQGLRVTDILETHVHADFVSGAVELKARLPYEARIHCSGLGGAEWTPPYADAVIGDGDDVSFGGLRLKALHTPGHTLEHVGWALFDRARSGKTPWVLFTGDFLFVADVGRPDLLGPEAQQRLAHELYRSVFERISDLPDFLELFPAHGAGSPCGKAIGSRESSTLGFERRFNASLRQLPEADWVATLLCGVPVAPPYFRRMKKINSAGPRVIDPELPGRKGFSAKAAHHIHGGLLQDRIHEVPGDRAVAVVCGSGYRASIAASFLKRAGYEEVSNVIGGMTAWINADLAVSTT
jgi:hydroxyacylglutathione hydrolase